MTLGMCMSLLLTRVRLALDRALRPNLQLSSSALTAPDGRTIRLWVVDGRAGGGGRRTAVGEGCLSPTGAPLWPPDGAPPPAAVLRRWLLATLAIPPHARLAEA